MKMGHSSQKQAEYPRHLYIKIKHRTFAATKCETTITYYQNEIKKENEKKSNDDRPNSHGADPGTANEGDRG